MRLFFPVTFFRIVSILQLTYNVNKLNARTGTPKECVKLTNVHGKKMNNNLNVVLTGTPSDSHTWNLVFIELFLQENGCKVRNLGPCVPCEKIYGTLEGQPFDLLVISSVNGHLFQDAINIITSSFRRHCASLPPFVVGGKMGISDKSALFQKKKLIALGYDDVFVEGDSLAHFKKYLDCLAVFKEKTLLKHAV